LKNNGLRQFFPKFETDVRSDLCTALAAEQDCIDDLSSAAGFGGLTCAELEEAKKSVASHHQ